MKTDLFSCFLFRIKTAAAFRQPLYDVTEYHVLSYCYNFFIRLCGGGIRDQSFKLPFVHQLEKVFGYA